MMMVVPMRNVVYINLISLAALDVSQHLEEAIPSPTVHQSQPDPRSFRLTRMTYVTQSEVVEEDKVVVTVRQQVTRRLHCVRPHVPFLCKDTHTTDFHKVFVCLNGKFVQPIQMQKAKPKNRKSQQRPPQLFESCDVAQERPCGQYSQQSERYITQGAA